MTSSALCRQEAWPASCGASPATAVNNERSCTTGVVLCCVSAARRRRFSLCFQNIGSDCFRELHALFITQLRVSD